MTAKRPLIVGYDPRPVVRCSSCSAELTEAARFCSSCGEAISSFSQMPTGLEDEKWATLRLLRRR